MNVYGAKTLGLRIHTMRKNRKMTSEKLSEYCDVGAVHIRKIESGVKLPSISVFVNICNALNVSPQYLLQDSLEPNELTELLEKVDRLKKLSKKELEILSDFVDYLIDKHGQK